MAGREAINLNRYSDLASWCETFEWEFQGRQIESGVLEASISSYTGKHTHLHQTQLNKRLHQRGASTNDWVHFAIVFDQGRLVWRRNDLACESLLNFNDPQGIDAVSENCFTAFIISSDSSRLQQSAQLLGLDVEVERFFTESAFNTMSGDKVTLLRRRMQQLQSMLQRVPLAANSIAAIEEIDGNLPMQLLHTLAETEETHHPLAAPVRGNVLGRALEYIDHHANEPITVQHLCQETAVSWRTLERAFRNHFQITPKAYLKFVRLNGVRQALLSAHTSDKVLDLAYRWGFWHSGQFASDYRKHFGELPTQTLRK